MTAVSAAPGLRVSKHKNNIHIPPVNESWMCMNKVDFLTAHSYIYNDNNNRFKLVLSIDITDMNIIVFIYFYVYLMYLCIIL